MYSISPNVCPFPEGMGYVKPPRALVTVTPAIAELFRIQQNQEDLEKLGLVNTETTCSWKIPTSNQLVPFDQDLSNIHQVTY